MPGEPEPTAVQTVFVVTEPEPSLVEPGAEPMVVRLDDETTALLLLTSSIVALGVGARVVGSFGGR